MVKGNPKSNLAFFKGILPSYFSSEWSFAHFRVPDAQSIVAFGATEHSIIGELSFLSFSLLTIVCVHFFGGTVWMMMLMTVVSATGNFYKAKFDPNKPGKECEQVWVAKFMQSPKAQQQQQQQRRR